MDKLIVKGMGKPVDGEYEFELAGLLGVGSSDALTNREAHRIKRMSGVRIGELEEALIAGDNDVFIALAAVIVDRTGKTLNEEKLWDAPVGSGASFVLDTTEEADEEGPPVVPAVTPEPPSRSGGTSFALISGSQESGQSRTGPLDSEKSVTYAPATSGT